MTFNRRGPQAKHGSRLGARLGILLPTLLFSPLLASPQLFSPLSSEVRSVRVT
ncbi:hypothetical protein GBAR_LOCUS2631 [Geodia barretti]|uniref:Uncharacterized protein n=1 Tax=Geodia barretti TaxID=519541 RepID=A0AA35W568_GEOBA|nr:hypothetical protein GBAR_LOCUS2631 [Geodia barretti]